MNPWGSLVQLCLSLFFSSVPLNRSKTVTSVDGMFGGDFVVTKGKKKKKEKLNLEENKPQMDSLDYNLVEQLTMKKAESKCF